MKQFKAGDNVQYCENVCKAWRMPYGQLVGKVTMEFEAGLLGPLQSGQLVAVQWPGLEQDIMVAAHDLELVSAPGDGQKLSYKLEVVLEALRKALRRGHDLDTCYRIDHEYWPELYESLKQLTGQVKELEAEHDELVEEE